MTTDRISQHLSVGEFIATQHRDLLSEQEQAWVADEQLHRNAARLAREVFEPIRTVLGVPLHVTSGYRCKALNDAVGGKPRSLHLEALAVDVIPVGLDPQPALFVILHAMRRGELPHVDQVIVEMARWLHLAATRDGVPARSLALETADGRTFARVV